VLPQRFLFFLSLFLFFPFLFPRRERRSGDRARTDALSPGEGRRRDPPKSPLQFLSASRRCISSGQNPLSIDDSVISSESIRRVSRNASVPKRRRLCEIPSRALIVVHSFPFLRATHKHSSHTIEYSHFREQLFDARRSAKRTERARLRDNTLLSRSDLLRRLLRKRERQQQQQHQQQQQRQQR